MEKYQRVKKDQERAPDNEVRVNKRTNTSSYVKYIIS